MRRLSVVAAALLCVAAVSTIGTPAVASASSEYPPIPKGPITFGISVPLSGALAAYGIFTKNGIAEALKAFKADHPNGIDGHQVKIQILNDASNVTQAVQVANQFVANKDAGILTVSYDPAAADQQVAVYTKAHMPVISALGGNRYANTKRYPYLFSSLPSGQQQAEVAAHWIAKKKYKKIAILNDGVPDDVEFQAQFLKTLRKAAPNVKVVASATISSSSGSVSAAAPVSQLKAGNPDLVVVIMGAHFGPVWQAIQAANWAPPILTSGNAWYDGFTALGPLLPTTNAYFWSCANSPTEVFTPEQSALMDAYAAVTSHLAVNYLGFIANDSVPLELMNYAISKYHSVDPAAIKKGLESIHDKSFLGFDYTFSASNHYGLTGQYSAAVCKMGTPYAGGSGKVPVKS